MKPAGLISFFLGHIGWLVSPWERQYRQSRGVQGGIWAFMGDSNEGGNSISRLDAGSEYYTPNMFSIYHPKLVKNSQLCKIGIVEFLFTESFLLKS